MNTIHICIYTYTCLYTYANMYTYIHIMKSQYRAAAIIFVLMAYHYIVGF